MARANGSSPTTVAAVDLGSNSFHLIVARRQGRELVVVDRLREMVQLAAGLDRGRNLSRPARQRALECLRRFGQRLEHLPDERVRAVGTNTLRSARNAGRFRRAAEKALGHPIETISGIEEARLVYLGVAHSLPSPSVRRLVVDIGGGSTELIVGEDFQPQLMESLYLGCVTMSRRWFGNGRITAARWRKAELAALQELEPLQARFARSEWEKAVGASGTVRTAEAVARAAGWSKAGITRKALKKIRDAILKQEATEHLLLEGLSPERASVFPGGIAVLLAVFDTLGIDHMDATEGALREGLLYDLVGRIGKKDVRDRSVAALAARFHVDPHQAARVEATVLELLDQAGRRWRLDKPEIRQLASWAAKLHEIGLDIAHQQYHRHGEYIIAQADLMGFSREEQKVVASLVRAHRRRFPLSVFSDLPPQSSRRTERLAVLLRLGVVLHRSRTPVPLPEVGLEVKRRSLTLSFPKGWLDEHPLTRTDLEQEASYLESAGYEITYS